MPLQVTRGDVLIVRAQAALGSCKKIAELAWLGLTDIIHHNSHPEQHVN